MSESPERVSTEVERADEAGLRRAYELYGRELRGYARHSLRHGEGADDVVQETFARAWRSRRRFDARRAPLRTWLFAIERRVIIDVVKRQECRASESLLDTDGVGSFDLDAAVMGWQVERALARLSEDHRRVLVELYFEGRTSRDVASRLGIPEGTVRSRAFYALKVLRVMSEEEGWST